MAMSSKIFKVISTRNEYFSEMVLISLSPLSCPSNCPGPSSSRSDHAPDVARPQPIRFVGGGQPMGFEHFSPTDPLTSISASTEHLRGVTSTMPGLPLTTSLPVGALTRHLSEEDDRRQPKMIRTVSPKGDGRYLEGT